MQNKKGEKKSKKRFLSGTNRLIERSKFHIKKMALWVYTRPWKKGRKSWTSRRQKISKDIPLEKTFLQLFTRQVNVCGDRIAVTGKGQFSNGNILHLTYRVLHEKSDLLACFLSNKKVRPDTITGIIMERSIEMITCLLAVWKAGGAYLPIEPEYPQERIDFMLKDSNAKILINKSEIRNPKLETNPNKTNSNDQNKKQLFETVSVLNFEHLNLNSIKGCPRRGFSNFVLRASDLNSSNLAYIIYTSGSTGRPKGVLVDHGNVAAYLHAFTREFKFTPGDIILQQASYTFDTFVEEVYGALIAGSKIAIADNRTTRDIDLLSEFIEKFNITVMDCVPLLLNELNKSCAAAHERRRLRSIHTFISGGDVLKYRHIDNLLKTGKVYNTYGPSETTVCASYYRCPMRNTFQVHSAISIGKAITGYDIFIINPNGDPVVNEGVGELWITGQGVTRGYLNHPELTAEKFGPQIKLMPQISQIKNKINKSFAGVKGGLFQKPSPFAYKTGDLGCRLPDGNIAYMGRMDYQVKVRGIRIELKEIEAHLDAHPGIREATVTVRDDAGDDKYLAAYVVPFDPGANLDAGVLKKYLSTKLPEYMIPSYFVILDRMPMTPTGKLDRWALMALSDSDEDDTPNGFETKIPPAGKSKESMVQETLVQVWQNILKIKKISIHDNFFQLGGHSLRVMKVISEIRSLFNVPVKAADLFTKPTIKELAALIINLSPDHYKDDFPALEAVEKRDYYPASSLQKRLYILNRIENVGIAYNIPDVNVLKGQIKYQCIEEVCHILINRHESLRISFQIVGEEVALRVHESRELDFHMSYFEIRAGSKEEISRIIQNFIQPFDLNRAPLFRACLIKIAAEEFLFLYDMHHIIADGMSSLILEHEFIRLLENCQLPELTIQYKDFSQWQNRVLKSGNLKKQENYWLEQFYGEIPVLNLPLDYPPPAIQSFAGDSIDFMINTGANFQLNQFLKETGVTCYMFLLAIYNALLYRYTGQEDIIVGSPTACRNPGKIVSSNLDDVIGLFINIMVLRNFPRGPQTFKQLLEEVKENVLNAFENQEYPYGELIEKLSLKKDLSTNALFTVELIVHNMEIFGTENRVRHDIPKRIEKAAELNDYGYMMKISQVDITLVAVEKPGSLACTLIYCTQLFKRETMESFVRHFTRLLEYFTLHLNARILDAPLLSDDEKQQILLFSNGTEIPLSNECLVPRLIQEQMERTPDSISIIGSFVEPFLLPTKEIQITYRHLDEKSDQMAALLLKKGIAADDIAGIMVERSLEMFIGLLGIWKAGAAYLPIDPEYPQERIDYMLKDSNAKVLIINKSEIRNPKLETNPNKTNSNNQNKNQNSWAALVLNFEHLNLNSIKGCPRRGLSNFDIRASNLNSSNLAYIIYTSGSTGRPKGVLVEHGNLAAYLTAFRKEFTISEPDVVLQQAAFTFDAFAEEIYPALVSGAKLAAPGRDDIANARLLTKFILKHGINIIDCSPLLLNELNKYLPGEVSHICFAVFTFISGGDVLKKEYIGRLLDIGTVYNTYGPTESTICASYYRCTADVDPIPPIGRPIANYGVYILDKNSNLLPGGVVGELCITGPGVTRGYLNQPGLTAAKFGPQIKNKSFFGGKGAVFSKKAPFFYRTGDLARRLHGGTISFVGRIDNQVKIRGYRIETAEIEAQLVTHPGINAAVVMVREDKKGNKQLCAYIVAEALPPGLREFLSDRLPLYMIPSHFTAIDRIPLTPLGKIDRNALPGYVSLPATGEYIAPGNLLEEKLAEIWAEILDIEKKKLSTLANFFHLGGHSLKAALLVNEIYNKLNTGISMVDVFKHPTIRELCQVVRNKGKKTFAPLENAEKKEYYRLSPAQKRMYILQQWEPDSPGYNVSDAISLSGPVDPVAIEKIFKNLIHRHESFRTSFYMKDREPVQKIHKEVDFKIEYFNIAAKEAGNSEDEFYHSTFISDHFIHSFDLSQAPLLRVGIAGISREQHILMMDMHHIISDGISLYLLSKEFIDLYRGDELPPLRFQYKDYSAWKNRRLELKEKEIKNQEIYWLKQFEDQIPVLSLPQDFPRPPVKNFKGRHINFAMGKDFVQRFYEMATREDVTLYILLFVIFNIFIYKLSGSEDIVAGTPVAGRRHPDLRQIIGMFVNTLALRNFPAGKKNFFYFLKEVKKRFWEALENQDYEFEELVERLGVIRDPSRNPLFDIMFTLRSSETYRGNSPHPEIQDMPPSYAYSHRVARFDLILLAVEDDKDLLFTLEYSTELFKDETAERFAQYFKNMALTILENPGRKLSEFELITAEEKQKLLYDFNNAPGQYPKIKTIPQLFEEQTAQTPNVIALVASETREKHEKHVETLRATSLQITYFELNRQADQAEGALNEKGVLPDTIVAIMMERSIEMIIAIMSILKAGGAYLPIDPEYPQERIDYMLKDSKAKFLVTEKFFRGSRGAALQKSPPCSSNLAYVIYTSGSTGKPKGVLTTHANVIRVVKNTNYIEIKGHDRLLQLSNYAFDGSVFDIFGALLNQAALILPGKEHVSSAPILANLIQKENITIFFVTTALFNILVDEAPWAFKNTRKVLFGGERVSVEHVEKALAHLGKERIIHMYGPTETTVYATYYLIDEKKEGDRIIPIGKPVSDTSIYILDNSMNLAPIGVSGELYIAGGGTARGYLNNPELTNDRFIFPPGTSATRNPFEKGFLDFPKLLINHQSPITNHQLPIYKTGDLARWLSAGPPAGGDSGGVIEFLGRIDSQVKIRGFRIEIGEIENRLLKHKAVKEAFVTIGGKAGDKYLCAYYVLHKDPGNSCDTSDPSAQSEFDAKKRAAELKEYLAQTLPAYMVPAYMISMEKFPLTPNGKIDKKKLPGPDIAELAGVYVPPGDETEEKLVQIWSEVLGIDSHIIGINTNFFQLGGHSLKAIVMVDKIQINFQVKILLTDLFQRQSIKELADYIKIKRINREIQEPDTLEPVEIKEYYTLTPEQERMFELHRFYGYGNRIFNMPWIGELEPENETNLEKAFRELIQRHESLRTSFLLVKGKPVQVIHKQVEFAIEKLKLNIKEFNVGKEKKLAEVIESTFFQSSGFIRAFDLSRAPLLRVGMTKMRNGKLLLMIDMHHIISDGTSYSILLKELNDLLKGKDSPPLKIQYKDYIQWQASEKKQKVLAKQEVYWLNLLSKPAPALTLPIDFPRPAIRGMAADVIDFELDQQLVKALRKLAKQQSSSFFMIMLALFNVLLFKLTAQEDILVSTFFAGRRNPDLRKMVGMFVKTLLLRNCPAGEKQFIPFLNEVKQQTLNAYENQDYSCERLLKTKTFNREKSFPAVNFVLQNMDPTVMLMSGFQVLQSAWADNKNKNETRVTFYDLRFEGFELGERLIFNVEYDINLFTEETINKFISDFKKIISSVLKNPWQEIAAL